MSTTTRDQSNRSVRDVIINTGVMQAGRSNNGGKKEKKSSKKTGGNEKTQQIVRPCAYRKHSNQRATKRIKLGYVCKKCKNWYKRNSYQAVLLMRMLCVCDLDNKYCRRHRMADIVNACQLETSDFPVRPSDYGDDLRSMSADEEHELVESNQEQQQQPLDPPTIELEPNEGEGAPHQEQNEEEENMRTARETSE